LGINSFAGKFISVSLKACSKDEIHKYSVLVLLASNLAGGQHISVF
jgi:hypothetical protein